MAMSVSEPNVLMPNVLPLRSAAVLISGWREHRDRDGVAGRGDEPQVGALLVGEHHRPEPDMHGLDFAGQQDLHAAVPPSMLTTSTLSPSFS